MKLNKFAPKKNLAQAMVEFAIVLPILLLLLYGVLEAGRLLFMYSSIVTASRQAARYGSATGLGLTNAVPRYQDCQGIREAANKADYLNSFDHTGDDIVISYDMGTEADGDSIPISPAWADGNSTCDGTTDTNVVPSDINTTRIVVTVKGHFYALVKLVPFPTREIKSTSSRTILMTVSIAVDSSGSGATPETPTITIDDTPAPSDAGELVPVKATVSSTSGTPDGKVTFSFDGIAIPTCTDVSLTGGIYTCNIRFFMTGDITVAFTPSDSAVYNPTDATKEHVVETAAVSITVYDDPALSLPGASVTVTAKVRNLYDIDGTYVIPTGSVTFTNDEAISCTDDLDSTGYASCGLVFTVDGNYEAVFTSTDSYHDGASATDSHQVSIYTATATTTPTATATLTPTLAFTPTLTPTATSTPTVAPTRVTGCNNIKDYFLSLPPPPPYALAISGTTMYVDIPNPNTYPVEISSIFVVWNGDKGHTGPGSKELRLMSVSLNGIIWQVPTGSLGQGGSSFTINAPFSIPAVLPPGSGATLTFTFDQTYNKPLNNGQEKVTVYFQTPGCEDYAFTVTR